MDFPGIPSTTLKPGVYIAFDTRAAARALPDNQQKCLLVGNRLPASIGPDVFVGSGLDDLATSGTFTGLLRRCFLVQIDGADTPDTFKWSVDGGANWSAETVAITGSAQVLAEGVSITFGATTGHTAGEYWVFYADPAGTADVLAPVQVLSAGEAATWFGQGSVLSLMCAAAFVASPYVDLWACAQEDDDAATAAGGALVITAGGTSGTLTVWIGNRRVSVAVASTDTAAAIALALALSINAEASLPVTATVSSATLTITAKNAGAAGNGISLTWLATYNCASVAVTAMTGGGTDPDIADVTETILPVQYHVVVPCANDAATLAALRDHLNLVSGPLEKRPGLAVAGYKGAVAGGQALASAVNSERLVIPLMKNSRSSPFEMGAAAGGVVAAETDPALPFNTAELAGIAAPEPGDALTRAEEEALLRAGVTPLYAEKDGRVRVRRMVTTYLRDAQGVPSATFLDVTTIRALDYGRYALRARLEAEFARAKNTKRTAAQVRSSLLDSMLRLDQAEVWENVEANADKLVVEKDDEDPGQLNASIPADVVNGLHIIAGVIEVIV